MKQTQLKSKVVNYSLFTVGNDEETNTVLRVDQRKDEKQGAKIYTCVYCMVFSEIPYSGYFLWGKTFVVFVVVKETTNIFLTKIYY